MSIIDKAIEIVSPAWAARREESRARLSVLRDILPQEITRAKATYKGGVTTRSSGSWPTDDTVQGGTALQRQRLMSQRDRARKAYKDNLVARSLLQTETNNVIAEGMELQCQTSSKAFDSECEYRWWEWLNRADITGTMTGCTLQRTAWELTRRDGDGGFILMRITGGHSRLQWIDGSRIATPDGKWGQNILDGVEQDRQGRAFAYHVRTEDERGRREFQRIPADDFVPIFHRDSPDMARGVSCFSTIFGMLDQIDGYVDAVVTAARMAAIFGLIFKKQGAAREYNSLTASIKDSQGDDRKGITLESGMVKYVGQGDEVAQVQATQPMSQTPDFIRAMMRLIGLPFDMPLELTLKDVSQVNFSSARVGMLQYYRAARARQEWFKTVFLSRVFRWWIARERKRSELGIGEFVEAFPDDFDRHEFQSRGWQYTDPVSEGQADQLAIDMGIESPQNVTARLGRDWETIQDQQKAAKEKREEMNLPIVMSNYTRSAVQGAPVAAEPTKEPNEPEPE